MACCSNCGCNYIVNLPDNPVAEYTAANLNIGGIGVYDSTTNSEFGFRGIISDNAALTVVLDAPNFTINLDLDVASIATQLPQATTSQAGVGETATDAEAIAKASTIAFVTPSNFAAMASSTTFAGLVELATNAETQAGASATLAVTPAGLASVTSAQKVTQVFADAVARAAATPLFEGQYGYQTDTNQTYSGFAVAAGSWVNVLVEGATNTLENATIIKMDNATTLTIEGTGAGDVLALGTNMVINVLSEASNFAGTDVNFSGTNVSFSATNVFLSGNALDLDSVAITISSGSVANSVLISDATNEFNAKLIDEFLSDENVQTGYTNFTNPAVLRTCDTATVTLPELAQIVGTLINDLKAKLLPAT